MNINTKVTTKNKSIGIVKILYDSAFIKLPMNNALKPRVSPHPGQGIPKILLNIQFTSNANTTIAPNVNSNKKANKICLFFLFT